MARLPRQEALNQLRVSAVVVLLPSIGYYSRSRSPAANDLPTTFGAILALLGVIAAISLWRADPSCRKLFTLWASLAAVAAIYPQAPLPGDPIWSGVVVVLVWALLAILTRQVHRGSVAMRMLSE